MSPFSPFTAIQTPSSTTQIFNDSVDAYAPWTLFFSFVSILILISGVVLLTHKKPEPSTTQRDGGIALNAIPGRHVSRTGGGKAEGHDEMHPEDHLEDGQALWDVGEASDEEDERTTLPTARKGGKGNYGEEGEHLMTASHDDDDTHTHATTTNGQRHTRRRSSSSILRRDNDRDRDDGDGFGAFAAA
jgi:hypothetical protein